MSTSAVDFEMPIAIDVSASDAELTVRLEDGRTISVPIHWYPRLAHGTLAERNHYEIDSFGEAIHWPDVDEDLSVKSIVAGWQSRETERSIRRWLEERRAAS